MKKGLLIGLIIIILVLIGLFIGFRTTKNTSAGAECALIVQNDLNTTGQPRDVCYINAAKLAKDESICEKVSTQQDQFGWTNRNACYTDVAVLKKDISICEKITQSQQKEICINSVSNT